MCSLEFKSPTNGFQSHTAITLPGASFWIIDSNFLALLLAHNIIANHPQLQREVRESIFFSVNSHMHDLFSLFYMFISTVNLHPSA